MLVKIQKSYRDVVAICDTELLGKRFEQGKFQLDIKESFYGGDEKSKEQTIEIIKTMAKEDATFNIVGPDSVHAALESGIISKEGIKKIAGIPFALVLL
jgi:hypothetical protein